MDSGSTDGTAAARPRRPAPRVVHRDDVLPEIPSCPARARCSGARSRRPPATSSCFVDADLEEFSAQTVAGLLGPLLSDESVALVKGFYDRPLRDGDSRSPTAAAG